MSPTLWAWCDHVPDPFPVATRDDPARLDKIREKVEAQLNGCEARYAVTEDDRQPVTVGHAG